MTTDPGDPATDARGGFGQAPVIRRRSLHEEVVTRLRDMIIEEDLRPGQRLPERELCEHFGISRTPLREAIKVLASEGLVELPPNRGATVTKLSPEDMQGMLQVIGVLEMLAGELACAVATDEEIREVVALHYEMMAQYAKRDRLAYFKLNQSIHAAIVRIAHNPTLSHAHTALSARMRQIRYYGNRYPDRWQMAVTEHEGFIAALQARNGAELGRGLRGHMESTWTAIQHHLAHEASV